MASTETRTVTLTEEEVSTLLHAIECVKINPGTGECDLPEEELTVYATIINKLIAPEYQEWCKANGLVSS